MQWVGQVPGSEGRSPQICRQGPGHQLIEALVLQMNVKARPDGRVDIGCQIGQCGF